MRYLVFGPERTQYPVCVLTRVLRTQDLQPYVKGIEADVVAYGITTGAKAKKPEKQAYIAELLPILCQLRTDYIVCTDGELFKELTGAKQVAKAQGYVLPCVIPENEHFWVIYAPSPQQVIYDPALLQKVTAAMAQLQAHRAGSYNAPGEGVIQFAEYPKALHEIQRWLLELLDRDLAIDIETYSLKHWSAGIGTITLAWSQHEGIAFAVDKDTPPSASRQIRMWLKEFFIERARRKKTRTLYHSPFDATVLTYQLFMADILDTAGMLEGMDAMLTGADDTQIITYLATNSCAGNKLSLKDQAQEFAGDWAVDVQDIRLVPLDDLLVYNLVDGLSTWYVYNKHWSTVIADQQEEIYQGLLKPMLYDIVQMQLTGLPLDMEEVKRGKAEMELHRDIALSSIMQSPIVKQYIQLRNERWVDEKNATLKKKRVTIDDAKETFNPSSPMQVQELLYEVMGLPVIAYSESKQPSTKGKVIKALIAHAKDENQKNLLEQFVDYKAVAKILEAFIPAFEAAPMGPDGWHYLFGSYKIGGTVSGRLSSHSPNMQNLPATGSRYAKIIKRMFAAPPGWLMVGLDYNSLEDMISALTTKDPQKLKVYTDGYDGHCLRAYSYFADQMQDIDPNSVDSINSIADKYKALRQKSKNPTFALTYGGTFVALMQQCGFTETEAKEIEKRYHDLYVVSDQWVAARIKQAEKDGYVTVAFGLRLRTPMLKQAVRGTRKTPYEVEAEGRTAGNALGQSWGLLNSRSANAFMKLVRAHPEYRTQIRHCAQIHDAQYYLVREDAALLAWMNQHLVKEVQWQDHPEIAHPDVHLGGELSIFYPTWANELAIPNGADEDQIITLAAEHMSHE